MFGGLLWGSSLSWKDFVKFHTALQWRGIRKRLCGDGGSCNITWAQNCTGCSAIPSRHRQLTEAEGGSHCGGYAELSGFWVWVLTVYRCCLGCSLWSRIYIEWDLSNNTFSGNANSRHLRRRASVSSWDSGTQPCFSVWSVVWSSDRETQFLSNTSFVFFDTVINFSRLQLPLIKIGSVCILWKPLEICILSQVAPDDISQLKFSGLYDFEN